MFQKTLNISRTKQDIEKLKTPLRLVWKCSVVFKIGSKIFSLQWHFNCRYVFSGNYVEYCIRMYIRIVVVMYDVHAPNGKQLPSC